MSTLDRDRFIKLWERCCSNGPGEPIFSVLEQSYTQPQRSYHTGEHIDHCLKQLDLARHEMEDADAIEMAIWFHDVEYEPHSSDNEFKSARRFKQLANGLIPETLSEQVQRLIMITIHSDPPGAIDEQYIVDIDLSSFGLPWDEFLQDSLNVRMEYSHLSDQEFAQRNSGFLRSLLDRSHIFSTDFYRNRLEENARENISKQIERLRRMQ